VGAVKDGGVVIKTHDIQNRVREMTDQPTTGYSVGYRDPEIASALHPYCASAG